MIVMMMVVCSDGDVDAQETLDPALTRPGRFDRRVAVPMPDVRGRLEILEHYLKVHHRRHFLLDRRAQKPNCC